ncbi:uncharacterized protein LOC106651351 [Trichogramma pretiosum]|uniref:uncharacterized protein LOC106651351 n=1 Tax=Trichogramma pretiosum TaxID=7493 RepID=UPI0006C9D071|nr:uncharacterized protein LOC106651351 [Trichogramma pretiosum]
MFKKVIILNKCTMCLTHNNRIISQITSREFNSYLMDRPDRSRKSRDSTSIQMQKNRYVLQKDENNIKGIKEMLSKYQICSNEIDDRLFMETPFVLEKKIMILQEMGVPEVQMKHLAEFSKLVFLSARSFKSRHKIDPSVNIAERLFSYVNNFEADFKRLEMLNDDIPMREYYLICFLHLVNKKLDLHNTPHEIPYKRFMFLIFNSFQLLPRLFSLIKNQLQMSPPVIKKNYRWLFSHHPSQSDAVIDVLKNDYPDLSLDILKKYPRLLDCNVEDLRKLIAYFKEYDITPNMVWCTHYIFYVSSVEFKRRMEFLSQNPYTLHLMKHPKFLTLVRDFHTILPRIKFLQEKNFKYASINSLTTFHNYSEHLVTARRQTTLNLQSFFATQFRQDGPRLLERLKKHPCHTFVPLLQMYENLCYLKENFPENVIHEHIYAILYDKEKISEVYSNLKNDPKYNDLPVDRYLPMSIYKIEQKDHFTGDGVLTPEKYAKSLSDIGDFQTECGRRKRNYGNESELYKI